MPERIPEMLSSVVVSFFASPSDGEEGLREADFLVSALP